MNKTTNNEALSRSEIPNTSEPKCADGCIYGWGSSECGHCDYRSEEPKTGDCISRQAAIDAINKMKIYRPLDSDRYVISDCLDKIVNLPSAQPERPKGYMKIKVISAVDGEDLFCENCDAYCLSPSYNFCPKCGVEFIGVRGEQDDES